MFDEDDSGVLFTTVAVSPTAEALNAHRLRSLVGMYLRAPTVGRGGKLTEYALVPLQLRWVHEIARAARLLDVYWGAVRETALARIEPLPTGATATTGHRGWWRERCALVRQAFPDPSAWLWNTGGLLQAVAGDDWVGLKHLVTLLPEHAVLGKPRWMDGGQGLVISCRLNALFQHPGEELPGLFLAEADALLTQTLEAYIRSRKAAEETT